MADFKALAPETVESERDTLFTISAEGLEIAQDENEYSESTAINLTPRASWDLLELLYKYRQVLYYSTHLDFGDAPAWIGARQVNTVEGAIAQDAQTLVCAGCGASVDPAHKYRDLHTKELLCSACFMSRFD